MGKLPIYIFQFNEKRNFKFTTLSENCGRFYPINEGKPFIRKQLDMNGFLTGPGRYVDAKDLLGSFVREISTGVLLELEI